MSPGELMPWLEVGPSVFQCVSMVSLVAFETTMSMDITSSDQKIMKRNAKKYLSLCMFLDAASDSIVVYIFCCSGFHKFRADSVMIV